MDSKKHLDEIERYIQTRLNLWETYHNHKENMANAGFLVQISLFGAITTKVIWPPQWVENVFDMPGYMTFIIYLILWGLIHYYMRWQLINKRIAAIYFSGFEAAYLKLITTTSIPKAKLKPYKSRDPMKSSKFKTFLASFIYISDGFIRMDASLQNLPTFIALEIKKKIEQGTGAATLEILMTYSSILMMLIVGIKTFSN